MSASDRSFVARMAERGVVQTAPTLRLPATDKNMVELAKILGFSRLAVNQWKLLEGAPRPMSNGKHSVKAWREFIGL